MFCESIKNKGIRNVQFSCIAVVIAIGIIHFTINRWRKRFLNENKERIIKSLLESCSELLFKNCSKDEWSICSMIQISYGNIRIIPYYVDAGWNDAIDKSYDLDFGDVWKAFFANNNSNGRFLFKKLSKNNYEQSDDQYKIQVPEELRAIIATAIYSKIDPGKVIGVLEFDVLTRNGTDEFPDDLYNSIRSISNQNTLGKWTSSIAFLLEGI